MKSDHKEFKLKDSVERIDQIISSRDDCFAELDGIPSRNSLTFTNGFYVKCSVLFVNIHEPAGLNDSNPQTENLKLYRACVSEAIAVMNSNEKCLEINVVENVVSGVFNTPWRENVDDVFTTAAKISSIVEIINCKFKKNCSKKATLGMGLSYGKALMVRAGYRGSSVTDVIWMGDVIKEAATLATYGNKEPTDRETMVSELFYYNLSEQNKKLLTLNSFRNCYNGDVLNSYFNNWQKLNCP